jgi:PAS domain S-box-containing protein
LNLKYLLNHYSFSKVQFNSMPDIQENEVVTELVNNLSEVEYWKQRCQKSENELQEINLQMSLIFQNLKQGYWYWNRLTDETYYSPEYFIILGYKNNEFVPSYDKWVSLVHPDDRQIATESQAKFLLNDLPEYDIEYRMLTKNEGYKWFLTRGFHIGKDAKGNWEKMVGVVTEIDKHKKHQEALLNNEIRLNLALETAKEGIWDWDLENETYYHSDTYYDLLGYAPGEVKLTFKFWTEIISPNDRERLIDLELRCIAGELDYYKTHYQMKVKSGQYRWFSSYAKVVKKNSAGRSTRMIGGIIDIDRRKRNEQALIESEETFRLLVERNLAGICIYDWEKMIYANPRFCEMFGYSTDELKNISIADIIHPDLSDGSWQVEVRDRQTKSPINRYQLKTIAKSGKVGWMDMSTMLIKYRGKQVTFATLYDITNSKKFEMDLQDSNEALRASEEELRQNSEELISINENLEVTKAQLEHLLQFQKEVNEKIERKNLKLYNQKKELRKTLQALKQTQEQLVQAEKMASLGVLVAGIAHELNNPVNYMSSSCEGLVIIFEDLVHVLQKYEEIEAHNAAQKIQEINLLKHRLDYQNLIPDAQSLIENINAGAMQTAEIVRGLRSFSRLEGDDLEEVNLHEVLDMSLVMLLNEYKYVCEVYKEYGKPIIIRALTGKLNQVFVNILANAIDAIKAQTDSNKKEIRLKTSVLRDSQPPMALIEITDTGVGIPEAIKNRVFEPFFTTKEVGKGTGLGLAISLGIIEKFGGKIEVWSMPNEGSKFSIYLPIQ